MELKQLLNTIQIRYQEILNINLVGIYIHGSIAFKCFNRNESDVDFLVIVHEEPTMEQKESLIRLLIDLTPESPHKGMEMSVCLLTDTLNFKYPTPFCLHFSNAHYENARKGLLDYCSAMHGNDPDLAAHFTVTKITGIVLCGKPVSEVFGDVPKKDYLASILRDMDGFEEAIFENPVSIILNVCRAVAYLKDGQVLSKAQGGEWGLFNLPYKYHLLIHKALNSYSKDGKMIIDKPLIKDYASYMRNQMMIYR